MKTYYFVIIIYLLLYLNKIYAVGYYSYSKEDVGTLSGDVQNWAMMIQNYILQLANDGIKREYTQSLFDSADYTYEDKDGDNLVQQVKASLGEYFLKKKKVAKALAEKVIELYDSQLLRNWTSGQNRLYTLNKSIYRDSDIPSRFPDELIFSPYFKQPVSFVSSTVKISDEVPRDDRETIDTVAWSAGLEDIFKKNSKLDPQLRWQYFGSTAGLVRIYPGREWNTNFAGFYDDYDPRLRPWYIAATSGPKDVVVILDCSSSMGSKEKFSIAQAIAKAVIDTLTRMDYVNVVCARASYWDQVGKWHEYTTEVLSCQPENMVQATLAHKKDLIAKIQKLKPGGTSEMERGFELAFDLLNGRTKTGCQSIIVFVTDGLDTDGEDVRCGPGQYSRSGFTAGPICRYNWTKVWQIVDTKIIYQKKHYGTELLKEFTANIDNNNNTADNSRTTTTTTSNEENKYTQTANDPSYKHDIFLAPPTRIFSYLTVEDGEEFPGRISCPHRGSFKKISTGVNLISQMFDYFDFLSSNSRTDEGLWTSPYLDSWGLSLIVTRALPCISKVTGKVIGVVGVDATVEDIENFLNRHQWGSVYSFLMNTDGETIFHPRLKASENLVADPIFIPIEQLEQDKEGNPKEFSKIVKDMKAGLTGSLIIPHSRPGRKKGEYTAATFYYAALDDSEFAFAFSLSDTDKVFRRAQQPKNLDTYDKSFFNLLIEYNSTLGRSELKGVFDYLQVKENEKRFPGLRVSYLHSSIFLSPKCHCDPNSYFYDDDLARKTVDAHLYINNMTGDDGCDKGGRYVKGLRADVFISQPVEKLWRTRSFDGIEDVKWTYVAMRSGVFRTYPAHRSRRNYDPTSRDWYKRANKAPSKTAISTAYPDSAGVGKIITLSRALFEGMTSRTTEECLTISTVGPWPGGCVCQKDEDCISAQCYLSVAPGPNKDLPRCATERVEAVTSLDILYKRFHEITMAIMQASDGRKSCGQTYLCPDGVEMCETRCYLFDDRANMITDPDFLTANDLDERKYKGVTMGKKEGEIMKELIYKHGFFQRKESLDFQDVCSISPYAPKVTLEGIPQTPEELDNYYKNKGPIPKFTNEYGCITDVVEYFVMESALGPSGVISGNVSGPCMSGYYHVTALPKTNLFLLVIENWRQYKDTFFFNFNCKITQSIVNSGSYRIINGTCAHTDIARSTLAQMGKCPMLRNVNITCRYNRDVPMKYSRIVGRFALLFAVFSRCFLKFYLRFCCV